MAAKGYTTVGKVQTHLGVTLTTAQIQAAEALIEPAEAWIDRRVRRQWLASAVTDEAHYALTGPHLYLRQAPITVVSSVVARTSLTDAGTTLVAGTTYELRDQASGWLYLPQMDPSYAGAVLPLPYRYDRVLVSYTPAASVPASIAYAATLLVIHGMRRVLDGVDPAVKRYQVTDELTVEYFDVVARGAPPEALERIDAYRRWSFA